MVEGRARNPERAPVTDRASAAVLARSRVGQISVEVAAVRPARPGTHGVKASRKAGAASASNPCSLGLGLSLTMPARNRDLHGSAPDKCETALLIVDVINDLD